MPETVASIALKLANNIEECSFKIVINMPLRQHRSISAVVAALKQVSESQNPSVKSILEIIKNNTDVFLLLNQHGHPESVKKIADNINCLVAMGPAQQQRPIVAEQKAEVELQAREAGQRARAEAERQQARARQIRAEGERLARAVERRARVRHAQAFLEELIGDIRGIVAVVRVARAAAPAHAAARAPQRQRLQQEEPVQPSVTVQLNHQLRGEEKDSNWRRDFFCPVTQGFIQGQVSKLAEYNNYYYSTAKLLQNFAPEREQNGNPRYYPNPFGSGKIPAEKGRKLYKSLREGGHDVTHEYRINFLVAASNEAIKKGIKPEEEFLSQLIAKCEWPEKLKAEVLEKMQQQQPQAPQVAAARPR